ncbi:hypothetical protein CHS0354_033804 [Potamilus streckersoni]|uniref:Ig-like domain-containing protein n=1 Tax=Potamilus streckersoni TaxID=2493646 RepID=A0AAE0SFD3_9BIVA|nr:hypothetical protein CHS0354_033804 [Potamilus streckersoni]
MHEEMLPKIIQHNILDSTLALQCRVSSTATGSFLWKVNGSLIENRDRKSAIICRSFHGVYNTPANAVERFDGFLNRFT